MKTLFYGILTLTVIIAAATEFLPPIVDKRMNPVTAHAPYTISPRAQRLHDSLLVGDWHSDTLLWKRDIGQQHQRGHVDIPRMQQGNIGLQMFTAVTKSPSGMNYQHNSAEARDNITSLTVAQRWPLKSWSSLTERALYQADKLHRFAEQYSDDIVLIKSQGDLAHWQRQRESNSDLIGALLGTEGSHALDGELSNVQRLYEAGFRMMSLQHFFDNRLGGSLHGESQAGLTDFGKQAIAEMYRLGVILDLSHSSEQVVHDVLEFYDRPIVVSHTGLHGHCPSDRNIADELMQQIAHGGGLIAIGFWDAAVCGTEPSDIVAAMRYGLDLVGEDHLALGSDFDGKVTTGLDAAELAALTEAMLQEGFSETQIRKIMGGNMLRLLQQSLPQ